MSYIVFARKWRPKTFDEIIGQEYIARTLKNAVKSGRVGHAYIFTGPRGIGKTSAARIFSKALNCQKGPGPEPCNKCVSCGEISASRSLDVLEIDGASNRGIDEIRNLRENVKFSPANGRFKIYIIDEVHMLTPDAFNALLKTLEEPPAHVKFVFATTEPNKVPLTILSRCQRFDFRRITATEIVNKLKFVAKEERLQIAEDALFTIAKAADGSMRDAESVLDQLASFSGKKIEAEDVTRVLGTLTQEALFDIVDALAARDAAKVLAILDALAREGKDMSLVALEILRHCRNLLIAKVGRDLKGLLELPEELVNRLLSQSDKFTIEDLLYAANAFSRAYDVIRKSNLGRIPLEMAMVKLARMDSIRSLGEILDKLSDLEEKGHTYRPGEAAPPAPGVFSEKPLQDKGTDRASRARRAADVKEDAGGTSDKSSDKDMTEKQKTPPPESKGAPAADMDLEMIKNIWPGIIKSIKSKRMSIASYLLEGEPAACRGGTLTLGFPKGRSFHRETLEADQNRKFIENIIEETLGRQVKLEFATIEGKEPNPEAIPDQPYSEEDMPEDIPVEETDSYQQDPIVGSALDMFKGRITDKRKK